MPRRPRIFPPGVSAHLIQRGNNRGQIFSRRLDYVIFLEFLRDKALVCEVEIHGFVLMTNHFHLLATPRSESSIPQLMQRLNLAYSTYYNRERQRVGTLWTGRYRALLIGDERYWLTCLRYIELNPLRAGMVESATEYAWSSYKAHAFGRGPDWLVPHPLYLSLGTTNEERQAAYRAICQQPVNPEESLRIRHGALR